LNEAAEKCRLPSSMSAYNSQRPWIIFWTLSTVVLSKNPNDMNDSEHYLKLETIVNIWSELKKFWNYEMGGMGAGPASDGYHLPHSLLTYAGVAATIIIYYYLKELPVTDKQCIQDIESTVIKWRVNYILFENKVFVDQGYTYTAPPMSSSYEDVPDIRAIYGVIATRYLLQVDDSNCKWKYRELYSIIELYQNHFDAGFVNFPRVNNSCGTTFGESHAGFTFAAVASWHILNRVCKADLKPFPSIDILINNLIDLQSRQSGGFRGRPHKLVDACYSSWAYAPIKMLRDFDTSIARDVDPFQLIIYILGACQGPAGGFKDKPGKSIDIYHSHNALVGLNLAAESLLKFDDNNESENSSEINELHSRFTHGFWKMDPALAIPQCIINKFHNIFIHNSI